MKLVAKTLGVARSNLVEQLRGTTRPRGSYHRQGDDELLAAIRQLTDARPTYGYRRITALLNRARRAAGAEPLNHKRVFRLMRQGQLLLQPHVGLRPTRAHEGRVVALASNQRWSSDGLEVMPSPCSPSFRAGSRTTTRTIPTAACGCAHHVSSSEASLNQPPVRFNGGHSRSSLSISSADT